MKAYAKSKHRPPACQRGAQGPGWPVLWALLSVLLILGVRGPCLCGEEDPFLPQREAMVREQIAARGVRDPSVLEAMTRVPRHRFVPEGLLSLAHADRPLPIGHGQTISQPYVVAFMTEALGPKPGEKILEIGTGSGYQAAVLHAMGAEVYTVEILEPLGKRAEETLRSLGLNRIRIKIGDGHQGWPEHAPYDGILVTCAPETIPPRLVEQVKEGGRVVLPVGKAGEIQHLVLGMKTGRELESRTLLPVRFVPMVWGPR